MSDEKGIYLNTIEFEYDPNEFDRKYRVIKAEFNFKVKDRNPVYKIRNRVMNQLYKIKGSVLSVKYDRDGSFYALLKKDDRCDEILNSMNKILLDDVAMFCPVRSIDDIVLLDLLNTGLNHDPSERKESPDDTDGRKRSRCSNIEGGLFVLQPFEADADRIVAVNVKYRKAKDTAFGDNLVTCPAMSFANTKKKQYMKFRPGTKIDDFITYMPTADGKMKPYDGDTHRCGDSLYIHHGYRRMPKAEVPFFEYDEFPKLDSSKVGILFDTMQQLRDTYPGIITKLGFIETFDFNGDTDHFGKKAKTNDNFIKEVGKQCTRHQFCIVNRSESENAGKAIGIFRKDLKTIFGIDVEIQDSVVPGKLNFVLLDKSAGDKNHTSYSDIAVQHISMRSYGDVAIARKKDIEWVENEKTGKKDLKGPKDGELSTLIVSVYNLLMKNDVLTGEQSFLDWIIKDKLISLPEKPLYFVHRPRRKTVDPEGLEYGYGDMTVLEYRPDGTVSLRHYARKDITEDWMDLCWSEFNDENRELKGIVSDGENVYGILTTDLFTVPDAEWVRNKLSDNAQNLEPTKSNKPSTSGIRNSDALNAIVDIRRHSFDDGTDYFFVGISSYDLKFSARCAPGMFKIERILGSDPVPSIIYQMMVVPFVRFKQLSVLPYPFKYIREYESMHRLSDDDKGVDDTETSDPGENKSKDTLDYWLP